jgi:hypothetical protein|tara:strand:+ start:205 stop:393 length:189 start_codon:yes stop_codon:yes gene_type:complete
MKFIIIIITVVALYFIVKIAKSTKEKTKNANNMILCKKCGYHVLIDEVCGTKKEIDMCPNRK